MVSLYFVLLYVNNAKEQIKALVFRYQICAGYLPIGRLGLTGLGAGRRDQGGESVNQKERIIFRDLNPAIL